MKELKQYQVKALERLLMYSKDGLMSGDPFTIVFQSPTGSGKTYSMSQFILRMLKDEDLKKEDICFLWVSIGKGSLHEQSYRSLKREFKIFPDVYLLENEFSGGRSFIDRNEVVVLNWEKLRTKDKETGDWKNILMQDKETYNFIDVLNNTREQGRKIVLVIDESHSSTNTERATELRDEIIQPDLTIEMSATPVINRPNCIVEVKSTDVINEGMIKKEILINENIDQITDNELDSETLILESAYQKRLEIKEGYKKEGVDINPLVLIQLPNSKDGVQKKEVVEKFLIEKGISVDNRNLAIWLSEEKEHTESPFLTPNNSNVDFLIFKQAIDTGWDCPRAQIMVKFRETKSMTFEIQTVGRILRMPEAHHYNNEILNKAYVYTNFTSFDVKKETYNPNIIKSLSISRNNDYVNLNLRSFYKKRINMGDVTSKIYDVFEEVFCDYFGIKVGDKSVINSNEKKFKKHLVVDGLNSGDKIILNKSVNPELLDGLPHVESNDKFEIKLSENDKARIFENIISNNLNGFARFLSLRNIKPALYRYFRDYMGIDFNNNGLVYIQSLIINNDQVFSELIDKSTFKYKKVKEQEIEEKNNSLDNWLDGWELPKTINYNSELFEEYPANLYIYDKCYLEKKTDKKDNPERAFIKYIEAQRDVVEWWWKNGDEHSAENFGIPYNKKGSTFQPDFIVKLKDGRLGMFDTKGAGYQEEDNKEKAEALQKYIEEENSKGGEFFGGIIIKEGEHLRVNNKDKYRSFKINPEDWEYLKF